jgi:hypothetical protein
MGAALFRRRNWSVAFQLKVLIPSYATGEPNEPLRDFTRVTLMGWAAPPSCAGGISTLT